MFQQERQRFEGSLQRKLSFFERRLLRQSLRSHSVDLYLHALHATERPLTKAEREGTALKPSDPPSQRQLAQGRPILPAQATSIKDFDPLLNPQQGLYGPGSIQSAETETGTLIDSSSTNRHFRIHVSRRELSPAHIEGFVSPSNPHSALPDSQRISQELTLRHENLHPATRIALAIFANRTYSAQSSGSQSQSIETKLEQAQSEANRTVWEMIHKDLNITGTSREERNAMNLLNRLQKSPLLRSARQSTRLDEKLRRAFLKGIVK